MSTARYLSCAETAKLVRQALKESFPGVNQAAEAMAAMRRRNSLRDQLANAKTVGGVQ